jgi:hypothetical protein
VQMSLFIRSALFILAVTTGQVNAQASSPSLHEAIVALDEALFRAFNTCDLATWRRYLAEDVEFYQDNDDVTTTRDELERSFKSRCGSGKTATLRRELLSESVEIHPIQGYGAVQFGTHRFWIVTQGKPDQLSSTPKFVHLWHNRDGVWQITRIISYGH